MLTLLTCVALCGVLWCGVSAYAQLSGLGTAEGFDANEYYEAPDNTKLKWRITGAKAQPLQRGRMFPSSDPSGFERAMDEPLRQAVVTSVGHWRGEGLALLEAVR